LVAEVAPGFNAARAGKPGVEIVQEHAGREGVLRTFPVDRQNPCILRGTFDVPKEKRTRLILCVSHEPQSTWRLTVNANGKRLYQSLVGETEAAPAWQTISIDLSSLAAGKASLELIQAAQGDKPTAAYWAEAEMVSE
jgi:hypothetical protein